MSEIIIETKDLTVYYGKYRGIKNVNLTVVKGEAFGFLGPNGAGKTTTQRVLLDVIRPTSGRASIFGMDCRKQGVEIRRRVGYLPGELALYKDMRADQFFNMYEYLGFKWLKGLLAGVGETARPGYQPQDRQLFTRQQTESGHRGSFHEPARPAHSG